MNKSKIINWSCVIVTICLCFFWYHMSYISNDKISIDKELLKKSIDVTITDISVKEFDKNGQLINFLETPKIEHIPKNNTHILTNPYIIVQEENKEPWYINAKLAKATNGGTKITFSDDVKIMQKKPVGTGDFLLSTEEITYFPGKKYAITTKNVKLQQNNSIVEATGLKAFLAESRIQFLKNARGHYEQKNG